METLMQRVLKRFSQTTTFSLLKYILNFVFTAYNKINHSDHMAKPLLSAQVKMPKNTVYNDNIK